MLIVARFAFCFVFLRQVFDEIWPSGLVVFQTEPDFVCVMRFRIVDQSVDVRMVGDTHRLSANVVKERTPEHGQDLLSVCEAE